MFVPSAANVSYYINIVEDRSVLRQLIKAGGEIMNEASTSDSPVTDILDEAERRVFSISMKKNEETLVPVDKSAMAAYMRIGELMRTRGQISGVPTGFRELDELTSGLQKGDLIIVAARPSVGKSTFAMNIAEYAATTAGKRVAVSETNCRLIRILIRNVFKEILVLLFPAPKEHKRHIFIEQFFQDRTHKVKAFLLRHARHHADQRRTGARCDIELLHQLFLVIVFSRKVVRRITAFKVLIRLRVKFFGVDSVKDTHKVVFACV